MAEAKKTTKASADSTDRKTAAETKAPVKVTETVEAVRPGEKIQPAEEPKEEAVKKESVKKTAEVKKAPVKKSSVKKTAAEPIKVAAEIKKAPAKKAESKEVINIQFEGKSYSTEDLIKMVKDVWKYDLMMKAADFKTVELYVKPEESLTYYVINGDVTGSFLI